MVAEVGDVGVSREELTREIQAQNDRMRETLGPAFDPAVTETAPSASRCSTSLIERKALLQEAQKLKFLAPDATLRRCAADPGLSAGWHVLAAAL